MSSTVCLLSPLGLVRIAGSEADVSVISCTDIQQPSADFPLPGGASLPEPVQQAIEQLQEYFDGTRQTFDFRLNPAGTAFQQTVWRALGDVLYGTTLSYLTLTRRIGDEKAIRAVAAANGKNPLWIVVPCHRIIGSDGSLTGYAGGLWRKQWLLDHERGGSGQLSLF